MSQLFGVAALPLRLLMVTFICSVKATTSWPLPVIASGQDRRVQGGNHDALFFFSAPPSSLNYILFSRIPRDIRRPFLIRYGAVCWHVAWDDALYQV